MAHSTPLRKASIVALSLTALAFTTALPSTALADDDDPKWTVQFDPLTAALGFMHIQIERAINDGWSFYAGPHVKFFDSLVTETETPFNGIGIEMGLRKFLIGDAPEGFWAQVRTVIARVSVPSTGASEFGGYTSALAGYTLILGDFFVLAGGLGVQYIYYNADGVGLKGFLPAAHTTFGFAF